MMSETLIKVTSFLILYKMVSHILVSILRKDGKESIYIKDAAGIGGELLFLIRRSSNKVLDCWVVSANISYFVGLALLILYSILSIN
jgi:hypothetical protein